jgi:hypothetical protein
MALATLGKTGALNIFKLNGRMYQTASDHPKSESDANALIAIGAATPLHSSYLAQYPWTTPAQK